MFNGMPDTKWVHNTNVGTSLGYESGRPDAFVFSRGNVACVECKGGMGSLYLGNPEDEKDGSGWTWAQRNWYQKVALTTQTPYWIAAWVCGERKPERVYQEKSALFLVSPVAWMKLEAEIRESEAWKGVRKVALTPELEHTGIRKDITLDLKWAKYRLHYDKGWHIPTNHPYWDWSSK